MHQCSRLWSLWGIKLNRREQSVTMGESPNREGAKRIAPALRRLSVGALSLLALALVSGCTAQGLPLISVTEANASLMEGYRIAGGDKVRVSVFDEPTLTGEFDVGLDGGLSMPLIGLVKAEGQSADLLAGEIAQRLSDGGYVIQPRVTVDVAQHRPFYILGEVQEPGEYPFVGDLTVEQAIAKAGGYTPRASRSEVVLRRADWPEARRVRLENLPLLIGPGDTIRVEEAFF